MPWHTARAGPCLQEKGDFDKAIADYTQAIRLDPKDAEAHFGRGCSYSKKGDHDKAIADFTDAIRLNPKHADAYHNRGWCLWPER